MDMERIEQMAYDIGYQRGYEKGKADRPQGEWETEYHGNGWNDYWDYTCSKCGKKYERADAVLYKANYCPNCGARMFAKDINVRSKDEPQTCSVNGRPYDCGNCEYFRCTADEPQTDCNGCKFVGTYDTEFPCANCSRKTKDYYAKDEPQTERKE